LVWKQVRSIAWPGSAAKGELAAALRSGTESKQKQPKRNTKNRQSFASGRAKFSKLSFTILVVIASKILCAAVARVFNLLYRSLVARVAWENLRSRFRFKPSRIEFCDTVPMDRDATPSGPNPAQDAK